MSATVDEWIVFRDEVAGLIRVPAESVTPDAVIGDDIDLDSLALSELCALIDERYGIDPMDDPQTFTWPGMSLGRLHELVGRPRPPLG
jgi:acyl carrier protein